MALKNQYLIDLLETVKKRNAGDFVTKWGTIATMLIMFILFKRTIGEKAG